MTNPVTTFLQSTEGQYMRWMVEHGQGRYLYEWWQSRKENYLLNKPSPWITFDARRFLMSKMHPAMKIFEWGSGGSTLFWLKSGATCVSVEHDPTWVNVVKNRLQGKPEAVNLDYRLIEPIKRVKPMEHPDPADPSLYASGDTAFDAYTFEPYARQIDTFPDHYFDIVLVDGRARPSCIVHGVNKVKPGGMMMVDNADRDYYFAQTNHLLKDFEKTSLYGTGPKNPVAWQTDFYLRK